MRLRALSASSLLFLLALGTALPLRAADQPTPEGVLAALDQLGRINGTALACGQQEVVARVKALVIQRAPKTRSYGEAFENATQAAFLERSRQGGTCPAAPELARQAETLAERLPPASADATAR